MTEVRVWFRTHNPKVIAFVYKGGLVFKNGMTDLEKKQARDWALSLGSARFEELRSLPPEHGLIGFAP